jgi:hypothetical protein
MKHYKGHESLLVVHGKLTYGKRKVTKGELNKIERTGKRIKKHKLQL